MSEWDWQESFKHTQFILSGFCTVEVKGCSSLPLLENVHVELTTWWEGNSFIKGEADMNMQRSHFLHTELIPWGHPGGKLVWAHFPRLHHGCTAGLSPPVRCHTHTAMCSLRSRKCREQILLLELEEAAGFQRQGLGGACFPAIWGNVTPPTSQILSQGCPVLPGRQAISSLRKDEFRYRGKGESSLLTTSGGDKKNFKMFLALSERQIHIKGAELASSVTVSVIQMLYGMYPTSWPFKKQNQNISFRQWKHTFLVLCKQCIVFLH